MAKPIRRSGDSPPALRALFDDDKLELPPAIIGEIDSDDELERTGFGTTVPETRSHLENRVGDNYPALGDLKQDDEIYPNLRDLELDAKVQPFPGDLEEARPVIREKTNSDNDLERRGFGAVVFGTRSNLEDQVGEVFLDSSDYDPDAEKDIIIPKTSEAGSMNEERPAVWEGAMKTVATDSSAVSGADSEERTSVFQESRVATGYDYLEDTDDVSGDGERAILPQDGVATIIDSSSSESKSTVKLQTGRQAKEIAALSKDMKELNKEVLALKRQVFELHAALGAGNRFGTALNEQATITSNHSHESYASGLSQPDAVELPNNSIPKYELDSHNVSRPHHLSQEVDLAAHGSLRLQGSDQSTAVRPIQDTSTIGLTDITTNENYVGFINPRLTHLFQEAGSVSNNSPRLPSISQPLAIHLMPVPTAATLTYNATDDMGNLHVTRIDTTNALSVFADINGSSTAGTTANNTTDGQENLSVIRIGTVNALSVNAAVDGTPSAARITTLNDIQESSMAVPFSISSRDQRESSSDQTLQQVSTLSEDEDIMYAGTSNLDGRLTVELQSDTFWF